jgi:hypothetical protein
MTSQYQAILKENIERIFYLSQPAGWPEIAFTIPVYSGFVI